MAPVVDTALNHHSLTITASLSRSYEITRKSFWKKWNNLMASLSWITTSPETFHEEKLHAAYPHPEVIGCGRPTPTPPTGDRVSTPPPHRW